MYDDSEWFRHLMLRLIIVWCALFSGNRVGFGGRALISNDFERVVTDLGHQTLEAFLPNFQLFSDNSQHNLRISFDQLTN